MIEEEHPTVTAAEVALHNSEVRFVRVRPRGQAFLGPPRAALRSNAPQKGTPLQKSCWVCIGGRAYDATDFLQDHPGGQRALLMYAGMDATEEFDLIHARHVLQRYIELDALVLVGRVEDAANVAGRNRGYVCALSDTVGLAGPQIRFAVGALMPFGCRRTLHILKTTRHLPSTIHPRAPLAPKRQTVTRQEGRRMLW